MVPLILLVTTFGTTMFAGSLLAGGNPLRHFPDIWMGLMFSVPLLSILGVHELGHYASAKHYRVDVTPPYFIPAPPLGLSIGTFGAFIKMRSPLPHRNALMDIGASGPIAGALVAVPILFIGLKMSSLVPLGPQTQIAFRLGEPLLLKAANWIVFGSVPAGYDVILHPVAFAGWIGLFVTSLNLLPSGQLDGGHIAYAVFGDRYAGFSRLVPYFLLPLGLLWGGWFVWAGLLFLLGTKHPRPVFVDVPLSSGRRGIGIAALLLFVLCFTPAPFSLPD